MQTFAVRSGSGYLRKYQLTLEQIQSGEEFSDTVEIAARQVQRHAGWQSVTYKGNRYQLFGGVCTFWFICLNSPLKKKTPCQ